MMKSLLPYDKARAQAYMILGQAAMAPAPHAAVTYMRRCTGHLVGPLSK